MRKLGRHTPKDIPLGLVYSGSASPSATQSLPKSNVPFIRRKQPNLANSPKTTHPALSASFQKGQRSAQKPLSQPKLAPNLTAVLSYRNPMIRDIADNFSVRSSRENIAKVYAAANTLGVKYRPISATNLFAYNAVAVSARRTAQPAANDASIHHPAKNRNVVPIRVGGPSVLSLIFGKSPLAGTGFVPHPKAAPSPTPLAAGPRMAA